MNSVLRRVSSVGSDQLAAVVTVLGTACANEMYPLVSTVIYIIAMLLAVVLEWK